MKRQKKRSSIVTNTPAAEVWTTDDTNAISWTKKMLAHVSLKVRQQQFDIFTTLFKPTIKTQILDVGVTPDEELVDSNFFEQVYPFPTSLTIASVEDCRKVVAQFNLKKFIRLDPLKPYPIKTKAYDIVTSWATLEHVGSLGDQHRFLVELGRVGKKVFLTTPYKYSPYELHTELFLLHWLPDTWFRWLLKKLGKHFWSKEENLRLLSLREAKVILPSKRWKVRRFYSFGFLPTHLIFYKLH